MQKGFFLEGGTKKSHINLSIKKRAKHENVRPQKEKRGEKDGTLLNGRVKRRAQGANRTPRSINKC